MSELRTENGELRTPAVKALSHFSLLTSHFRVGPRRGFALFLLTLSIGLILTGTALTLVAMQRSERRLQDNLAKTSELTWYARSGLETALAFIEQVSTWRTRAAANSGKLFEDFPIGDGLVTVQLYDDVDSSLTNNEVDRVRLRSTAKRGTATCVLEAQLKPRPHPALRYAVVTTSATDTDEFMNGTTVCGAVRAHGHVLASSSTAVPDETAFETMSGYTITAPATATKTYAATALTTPSSNATVLGATATVLTGDGGGRCDLYEYNLTPSYNPEGAANANGIYWLKAGNREVLIENLHLKGTLIITGIAQKVTIQEGLWLEPGPLNYPVLIIDCPTLQVEIRPTLTINEVTLYLSTGSLAASDINGNGALDLTTFPSQIRGLTWINCSHLYMRNSAWHFAGCLITPAITVDAGVVLDNDLTLQENFIPGYLDAGMALVAGSVREVWP